MSIKIAIVDDHELFRDGLSTLLERNDDFIISGIFENGKRFLDKIDMLVPDIVLMDFDMPEMNGEETTIAALKKYPNLKIIVLSLYSEIKYYHLMLAAGAKGFILKETGKVELFAAINEVYNGNTFFSQELLSKIITKLSVSPKSEHHYNFPTLTDREIAMIEALCKGMSNKEMSDHLFISVKTVESNKTKLFDKLKVKNTVELVVFAIKNGIVNV